MKALAGAATFLVLGCGISHQNYLRVGGEGRPEWKRTSLSLEGKAEAIEERTAAFVSAVGTLIYRQDSQGPFRYLDLGDVCDWTGAALGAASLRYAVTRDPAAFERARLLLGGLDLLHRVTGVRGLLARNAIPPGEAVEEGGRWFSGKGEFAGWRWRGDTSKDQYSGALFGLYAAWECLEDLEVRGKVGEIAAAIADHLLEHDFRLTEVSGEPTTYGDLRATIYLVPIGVNALISLCALKLAAVTRGEPRYEEAYRRKAGGCWASKTYWAKFQIFGRTNYNNDNMAFLCYYPLLRMEGEPEIREEYLASLRRSWSYVYREGNAFFTYLAAAFGEADPQALEEARLTLELFPADLRGFAFSHGGEPRFAHALLRSRKGRLKAKYPIPINWQSPSSFAWKRDPHELEGGEGEEGRFVYPGYDYLLAYWLARFHGFLP